MRVEILGSQILLITRAPPAHEVDYVHCERSNPLRKWIIIKVLELAEKNTLHIQKSSDNVYSKKQTRRTHFSQKQRAAAVIETPWETGEPQQAPCKRCSLQEGRDNDTGYFKQVFLTSKASSTATKLRCTISTAGDVWLCGLKFAVCPAEFKAYMGNTDLVLLRPLLAIILHIPLEHRLSPESFKHQPRKIKLINKSQTQVQVNNLINAKEGA